MQLAGQSRVPMPVREVRQFHFLVWPDHGVPQYATNLLSFRKRILKYHPEKRGPMTVHCRSVQGAGLVGCVVEWEVSCFGVVLYHITLCGVMPFPLQCWRGAHRHIHHH